MPIFDLPADAEVCSKHAHNAEYDAISNHEFDKVPAARLAVILHRSSMLTEMAKSIHDLGYSLSSDLLAFYESEAVRFAEQMILDVKNLQEIRSK